MIGAAIAMPILSIADLKLVIHVVTDMMVEMLVVMFLQAMKVKNISIATHVVLEWVQVKIWTNIVKIIQSIVDLKPVIHVVTDMMVEMPVVMFLQAMKVKTIITVILVVHQ